MDINSFSGTIHGNHHASRLALGLEAKGTGMTTSPTAVLPHRPARAGSTAIASPASNGAAASQANSNSITSNDFLTLLVTEMKNQDPTQPTDPNAYIQQLVGVNSLQQLISINSELAPATTPTSSGAKPAGIGSTST